jgi:hypothetical protein
MATWSVTDQASFTAACTGHSAGDVFQFAPGVDVTVPNAWDGTFGLKRNCRWEVTRGALDANPLGAPGGQDGTWSPCFTRMAIVRGFFKLDNTGSSASDTLYLGPISFRLPSDIALRWPGGAGGASWTATVGIPDLSFARAQPIWNDFLGTVTLDGTEWDHGWNTDARAHSMEYAYTTTDADNCYYGPSATFGNVGNIVATDIRLKSINGRGFVGKLKAGRSLTVTNMWAEKILTDCNQWSVDGPYATSQAPITYNRAIMFDAIGAQINARLSYTAIHADSYQLGASNSNGVCPTIRIARGMIVNSLDPDLTIAGPIGQIQGGFMVAPATGTINAYYNNIAVRDMLLLGVNKGVQIEAGCSAYVRNVVAINPTLMGSEFQTFAALFEFKQTRGVANARLGNVYIGDSIFEGISSTSAVTQSNNLSLSVQSASQATTFTGGSTPATLWDWYSYYRTSGAHATKGPQFATLRAFLDASLDFTGETPFFLPLALTGQAASTLATSSCAAIYGGDDGDLLDVVLPAGLEMAVFENDETTLLQTWFDASTNGTATNRIPVGKQGKVRATSSAVSGGIVSKSYSVGGQSFTWTITNASNQKLPRTNLSAFTGWTKTGKMQVSGADISSEAGTMLVGMRWTDLSSVSRQYIDNGTTLGGPDASGFGAAVACQFQNAGGSAVALANVATAGVFQTGRDYLVGFTFDMRADENGNRPATYADGAYFGVSDNGAAMAKRNTPTSSTWNTANLPVAWSNTTPTLLKRYANNDQTPTGADVMLLAATPEYVPLAQLESILTPYTVENWGPAGEGLSPTETPWPLWFVGRADRMAAGTANRGTGGTFTQVNALSLSQSLDMPWPPSLVLASALNPDATLYVGVPIAIDVFCNGYNDAHNLTMVAGGAAAAGGTYVGGASQAVAKGAQAPLLGRKVTRYFTPGATGALTIDFTSDHASGYTAPSQLSLTVVDAPVVAAVRRPTGLTLSRLRLGL